MAILEVVKDDYQGKKNNRRNTTIEEDDTLNNLNRKGSSSFDFSKDRNPEMAFGRLKKERGICGAIVSTIINCLIFIGVTAGAVFAVLKYFNFDITFFPEKNYYSVNAFNLEMMKFLLILFILLILSCFLCSLFVNISIRFRFRESYLKPSNVYVYDTFLMVLNIILFVFIAVVFFYIVNNYNNILSKWYADNILDSGVNLGILEVFKYVIVIIVAVFISLNSLIGIKITYKKNKFIFENHL